MSTSVEEHAAMVIGIQLLAEAGLWRFPALCDHLRDVLNRHRPIGPDVTQPTLRSYCGGCAPTMRSWADCPEVSGLRPILLAEVTRS
jgi:hypothetical protein